MKIVFFIVVLLINISCYAQNNINFYYQDKTQAKETDSIGYKFYLDNTPKELMKKDDEIILFFNNAAFIEEIIVVNGIKYKFENYTCGYRQIRVSKKAKRIEIKSKQKKKIEFNLKKEIDYIIISGDFENKWSVTFSEFFPIMECI